MRSRDFLSRIFHVVTLDVLEAFGIGVAFDCYGIL
jgi:hypothetical protein